MSIKILKNKNTVGFLLSGNLTGNDFINIIHDIESLCHEQDNVHILFKTNDLREHDFIINIKKFDLYRKFRRCIKKIAVVHEGKRAPFIKEQFGCFSDTNIRNFGFQQIEEANQWISN